MSYVSLHNHTEYSILDGCIKCPELAKRVKLLGQPAVAITDHGNLYGVLEFYKACRAEGIKPIIGVEAYLTADEDGLENKNKDNFHMVLLAKNNQGYKELLSLISNANEKNFYYKPRISYTNLKQIGSHGNLIATTACLGGPIAKVLAFDEASKIIQDNNDSAKRLLLSLRDIFGNDFYTELQKNTDPKQDPYNKWLINISKQENIKSIFTTDAHYLTKEDYAFHQLLMATQTGKTITEYKEDDELTYGPDFYIKSTDEMMLIANEYLLPEAIDNTLAIANQCNVEIELGKLYPPVFDTSKIADKKEFDLWLSTRTEAELN